MSHSIGLSVRAHDGKSSDAVFDGDSILIGSGPSAVLRLGDPGVSSIHAVIKVASEGGATIVDLGSEGGTTVNGTPVTAPQALQLGDEIGVGQAVLTLVSLAPAKGATKNSQPATKKGTDPMTAATHEPKKAGTNLVTDSSDFDPRLLSTPLAEAAKPTAEERVLEINVIWGDSVIDNVQVGEPRAVTVGGRNMGKSVSPLMGRSKSFDLEVEGFPADQFTIAMNQGAEAQIVIPANAKVGVRKSDGSIQKDPATSGTDAPFPAKAYQLKMGERLVYKAGTLTVTAQFVRGNAVLGKGGVMDWYFPRVFAISAMLHVFFVVAAFITPNTNRGLVDELFKNQNRFAQMILKAPEKEKENKKLDLSGMKGGAKHRGDEGKFGKKDLPKKDAMASKAGAPRVDPNKREKDRQIAMNSGLLGILKGAQGSGAVSNVFGPGGLGTGINNAMGGLRGSEMGDAGGAGGLGSRGTGAGGGGNSLGIGGLGNGTGRGTGGYGNIDLGGRGKGTTRIVPGKTIIQGSLSKEEIGRVIRRNLARFKYCYEKELNANPNLNGKISGYFTIAPTGSVADASVRETSMNDENVESCVTKVMRSLKFPQPRGGGIVVVTYPFVFAAT